MTIRGVRLHLVSPLPAKWQVEVRSHRYKALRTRCGLHLPVGYELTDGDLLRDRLAMCAVCQRSLGSTP